MEKCQDAVVKESGLPGIRGGRHMRPGRFLTVGALTLTCLTGTPAAAAEPVVAPGCSSVVDGKPGQSVVLGPASVAEPIVNALSALDPLHVLVGPFRGAWGAMAPIPVGTVPDGQAEIPGARIADAVTGRLDEIPLLAPVLSPLTTSVHNTLASLCGLLVRGVPPVAGPAAPPGTPAGPAVPGDRGASSPAAGQRFAPPGAAGSPVAGGGTVFGAQLSGMWPGGALFSVAESGALLGGPRPPTVRVSAPRSTGSAEALPAQPDELSLPVLLAVLLFTIVSAQLVRRWVLGARR
jgi:hypothetical protein